jgi:hypothetical protein
MKAGRKLLPIDRKKVEELSTIGCSVEEIACILTPDDAKQLIDHATIEKRFYTTIQKGRSTMHRALKRELVRQAMNGNTAALIFALKAYCGLRDLPENATINNVTSITITAVELRANEERLKKVGSAFDDWVERRKTIDVGNGNGHDDVSTQNNAEKD